MNSYTINSNILTLDFPTLLIINDGTDRYDRLKYHIKENDYFGTLATLLDLLSRNTTFTQNKKTSLLQDIKDDLLFLQKHYIIKKRKK